ncbi:MAG: ferrous iron transport protein B [Desulfovibrionaceae bacterium]
MSKVTIALAGNPNSGKTTMFNALTGARQHVGNYPGVTVEKKEGTLLGRSGEVHIVDLPGTYSLTAYTAEELAARDFLVNERPDAVLDILDANTLERGLYLAVQFLEMGVPLALALNMMDEVRKKGVRIDVARLSELLGVPVVPTVGRTGEGLTELVAEAEALARGRRGELRPLVISYSPELDEVLGQLAERIESEGFLTRKGPARWLALKYLEGDDQVIAMGRAEGGLSAELEQAADRLRRHCQATLNMDCEAIIADYRYGFIASLLKRGVVSREQPRDRLAMSDRIDKVVTHAVFGPLLMLGVLYGMFHLTFTLGETPLSWMEALFGWLGDTAAAVIPAGLLRSLVVSGVIDGVGGVLGFVPLIIIMFLMLSFLEDLGYMARMAYMLDRVFKAFGLHGASVMPFIISGGIPGGCAVPGVMAARTLRSPRERLATILTAPFMVCGAKIPVFILLIGAFFPGTGGMVLFWVTLGSWAAALLVSKFLRLTVLRGDPTPFIMELPPYRLPTLRGVVTHTMERAWQYVKKAGTTILAISVIFWAAMTFPGLPADQAARFDARDAAAQAELDRAAPGSPAAQVAEAALAQAGADRAETALQNSVAGRVGRALEPVSRLAGFDWRANIALLGGVAAKEVIVTTLATAYSLGETDPDNAQPLSDRLRADPDFTRATALALMIFIILYAPCFVTVVTMSREAGWRWAAFALVFNTGLGFVAATAVYQIFSRLL